MFNVSIPKGLGLMQERGKYCKGMLLDEMRTELASHFKEDKTFSLIFTTSAFLNQAYAGLWPAHAWFLRIASVRECLYACVCVCVCVCPPLRLLITSGMMWCDIDHIRLVK